MSVGGRPTKLTPEIKEQAEHYIIKGYEEQNHPIPSVIGLACTINVAESTLYKWAEEDRDGFSETLRKCKDNQHMALLHGGLNGTLNAAITKLALGNHAGYSEKAEQTVQGPGGGPIEMDHTWQIEVIEPEED